MTDPIERVARWLAEINHEDPDRAVAWNIEGGEAVEWVWHGYKFISAALIDRFTKQSIPIDKLLSGEMRAVDAQQAETLDELGKVLEQGINEAALDYAGNPPVEPAGATHSEKRDVVVAQWPSGAFRPTRKPQA